MADQVLPLSREAIHDVLKKQDFAHVELDKDTDQVSVIIKIENIEFPLFLKVLGQGELLQLLMFIPTRFKEDTVEGLARMLHSVNREVDFPGFGIEETSQTIFYRTVTPCLTKEISEELLLTLVRGAKVACQSFTPAIVAVASGELTFEELIKRLEEAAQKAEQK